MVTKAITWVVFLSGVSIAAFMVMSLPPGEKIFKMESHDRIEDAWRLKDALHLRSLYGHLDAAKDVDYITLPVDRTLPLRISIKNPDMDKGFEPEIILFGPGLPTAPKDLPIPIGDTNGAVVATTDIAKQKKQFEISELTGYLTGPDITVDIKEPGTYAIAILSPSGEVGRYVLSIGSISERGIMARIRQIVPTLRVIFRLY
jgi:hypothetical protein